MHVGEFIKTLSDDNLIQIMRDFAKFDNQGCLDQSYLWKVTEELMTLLGVKGADGIQQNFWARVLHDEVCKNLAWRWVSEHCGGF